MSFRLLGGTQSVHGVDMKEFFLKRTICLLLSAAILFSLCACGDTKAAIEDVNFDTKLDAEYKNATLDLRVKVKDAHYLTVMGNYARDCDRFSEYTKGAGFWGVGLEYGYDSVVGPITINAHYSNLSHNPGAYVSIGVIF